MINHLFDYLLCTIVMADFCLFHNLLLLLLLAIQFQFQSLKTQNGTRVGCTQLLFTSLFTNVLYL